jgi:hypothetical protein
MLLVIASILQAKAQYVTLDGRQFKHANGQDFYPIQLDYHPMLTSPSSPANISTVFFSPYVHSGNSLNFECHNTSQCAADIHKDFAKIKELGFNTIRITTGPDWDNTANKLYLACWPDYQVTNWLPEKIFIDYPYDTNNHPVIQPYFDKLELLIDIAEEEELYVMIDGVLFHDDQGYYDNASPYIADYYRELAKRFKLKTNLIAYIMLEEASLSDKSSFTRTKESVCSMTNLFYDAFKENDSNHLISISGFDCLDVMHWDPGVMKADFYRAHMYPYIREDGSNIEAGIQRIESRLYWLAKNCPMPWMIGESGFRAQVTGFPLEIYDGTEEDQHLFADFEINRVRDCNASGYSWFGFQQGWTEADVWYNSSAYPDGHHLVDSGNIASPPNSVLDRPACSTFKYYQLPNPNFTSCTKPAYYYDPYHLNGPLNNLPSNLPYRVYGTITENEPEAYPIEDAIIYGNGKYYDLDHLSHDKISYTFTDSIGNYVLNIAPYQQSTGVKFFWIKISSIGSETILINDYNGPLPLSYNTFLNGANLNYNFNIANKVIHPSTNNQNFYGWNSINASNISIASGANSDFKARKEITLLSSIECKNGSEVHFSCGEVYAECSLLTKTPNHNWLNNFTSRQAVALGKKLQLQFSTHAPGSIKVVPNPGTGIFSIHTDSDLQTIGTIKVMVYDLSGRMLRLTEIPIGSNTLDLTTLSNGAYTIRIMHNGSIYVQKLIIYSDKTK